MAGSTYDGVGFVIGDGKSCLCADWLGCWLQLNGFYGGQGCEVIFH